MLGFILGLVAGGPDAGRGWEPLLGEARRGNPQARDDLIRRFLPLALKVAARQTGRYVRLGEDDEASIAMAALNEAIDHYDEGRGVSFVAFARTVVSRRLVDHFRRQHGRPEIPVSALEDGEQPGAVSRAEEAAAMSHFQAAEEAWERRQEVLRYGQRLQEFGVALTELVAVSPRHSDARQRAVAAARALAGDADLSRHLLERRELPLLALEKRVAISRKTLERQRKYIIAVALILLEDFVCLRRYIGQG